MSYRGVPTTDTNYMEKHNDDLVDHLAGRVSTLKNISIAIGNDVREQNRLLNEMDSEFDSGRGLMSATMNRLGIVSRAGGHKMLCYLVMFSLFVFFVIYYIAR